jgi:hypothetical protein
MYVAINPLQGILKSEMSIPQSIPTSFVPHPGGTNRPHASLDTFGTLLAVTGYLSLFIVFLLALGVFFYGRILAGTIVTKDAALAKAQQEIDPETARGFVQLRDRLDSSQQLLTNHLAPSGFFSALQSVTPSSVRFSGLHFSVDTDGIVKVEGAGVAKSFNALSVASTAFGTDARFKDSLFSKITINPNNSVSFSFSTTLSPKLISFSPVKTAVSAPSATSTTP